MEASLYEKLEENAVRCHLCHHRCRIKEGRRGICQVRENRHGVLETLVYGRLIARHVDPIEKKPLFHVLPGTRSYSIATVGCNFRCAFCQNADIAQLPADRGGMILGDPATPEEIVADALARGCRSIAYTYTEPTVFFEFARDTARLATAKGLRNVFVTNGYMTPEMLDTAHPWLDAANVDLKAFTDRFYQQLCGATLQPVLDTLIYIRNETSVHLEVTTLLIPGWNDSPSEIDAMTKWAVANLGPDVPWHFSAYRPTIKWNEAPPTPLQTLLDAKSIAELNGLNRVHLGNVGIAA